MIGLQLGGWCKEVSSSASKYKFLDFQTDSIPKWLETMRDQEDKETIPSEERCPNPSEETKSNVRTGGEGSESQDDKVVKESDLKYPFQVGNSAANLNKSKIFL